VVRHLEASALDDALDLFALLMGVGLFSAARRAPDGEWLAVRRLPALASRKVKVKRSLIAYDHGKNPGSRHLG
jgi:hypothetical protein